VRAGDVVLLRTGWAQFWEDAARYICQVKGPGPGAPGARWLSERGIFAAGSDTVAFEQVPDPSMPVHVHLLVERGIHIIECLNMEQWAVEGVSEFALVAVRLKTRGGRGSPTRRMGRRDDTDIRISPGRGDRRTRARRLSARQAGRRGIGPPHRAVSQRPLQPD